MTGARTPSLEPSKRELPVHRSWYWICLACKDRLRHPSPCFTTRLVCSHGGVSCFSKKKKLCTQLINQQSAVLAQNQTPLKAIPNPVSAVQYPEDCSPLQSGWRRSGTYSLHCRLFIAGKHQQCPPSLLSSPAHIALCICTKLVITTVCESHPNTRDYPFAPNAQY